MSIKPFAVFPESRPRSLNVVGEQVTILASKAATHGYEVFFQDGPDGSGPPPHSHPWDETFYLIRGDIEFGIDEKSMIAKPGPLVHLPVRLQNMNRNSGTMEEASKDRIIATATRGTGR